MLHVILCVRSEFAFVICIQRRLVMIFILSYFVIFQHFLLHLDFLTNALCNWQRQMFSPRDLQTQTDIVLHYHVNRIVAFAYHESTIQVMISPDQRFQSMTEIDTSYRQKRFLRAFFTESNIFYRSQIDHVFQFFKFQNQKKKE